jgi:hypothetical protein
MFVTPQGEAHYTLKRPTQGSADVFGIELTEHAGARMVGHEVRKLDPCPHRLDHLSDDLTFRLVPPTVCGGLHEERSPATTLSCRAMKQIKHIGLIAHATERCPDEISRNGNGIASRFHSGATRSAIEQT